MSTIEFIYIVCLFLGLGFAVLSGLLAGVFSGGAEAHVDVGGGHVDLGHGMEGAVHFPILSPVTISMFVATFGGCGLLFMKYFHWPAAIHVTASIVAAGAVAFATAWLLYVIFKATSAGAPPDAAEAVGLDAEVTVAIPHGGLGEIAFTVRGSRLTSPARTEDGKELPASSAVKIVKQVGTTYLVRKLG
jgi:hypothetical protein